ncbi:Hermansky-Pudlak syndrome 1 protein [Lamellibrachia satsuma]|nr:Hermansky-Pudlak syndrome 1 protein [Lamellibrachia satsuma]
MDDVAFMSIDDEYNKYLKKCARAQGFIKDTDLDSSLDMNVIMQVFSPLLASQRFMTKQLENSYHSVKCETGFLFCFQQFSDECYIAVNGDGLETEQFLHHKLRVLHNILGFLLGPVSQAIRPDKVLMREDRWHFVSTLLTTWCDLYRAEQCFLIEAIERLHVSDELTAKCVRLLESALSSARAAGVRYAVHALLLVNNRLLALYSRRHTAPLATSDLLRLLLLTSATFPYHGCHDNDTTGLSTPDVDSEESNGKRQFFSTSTPIDGRPAPSLTSTPPTVSLPQGTDVSQETLTPPKPCDSQNTTTMPEPHDPCRRLFHERLPSVVHSSANSLLHSVENDSYFYQQSASSYHRLPVFLQTDECSFSPHICHCVELMPGICFVMLNEISRASHAEVICKMLDVINAVLHGQLEEIRTNCSPGGITNYKETLDASMQNLQDVLKTFKGARQVEHIMADICSKWRVAREYNIETNVSSHDAMHPRLESLLGRLRDRLVELFKLLYLLPRRQAPEVRVNITQGIELVGNMLRHHLVDYKDYLMVKSFHNITMTNYQQNFPGLIHFIYVNRATGHMTAPSVSKPGQTSEKLDLLLWQKVVWLQQRLTDGYTSALVRDGHFIYSYFIWFENKLGHTLKVQRPFKGSTSGVRPGVLSGDFYREMVLQCFPEIPSTSICCFELFCFHDGNLTTPQILRQDRKLVASLRQMTQDMSFPINVL